MSAIRLARAATGRERLVKFAGAYHGHVDGLLAEAGSGHGHRRDPAQPRRHRGPGGGDRDRPLERRRGGRRRRSPSAARRRSSPSRSRRTWVSSRPSPASSSTCAALADDSGALLVLDEVITGFRVARGGAQELLGVEADLTVMGKVLGGGLPAAAYGGSARADGAHRPGRRRLPGGDALGEPAGRRRRPRDACASWTPRPTSASATQPSGWPPGCATPPASGRSASPRSPAWSPPSSPTSRPRDFAGASACDAEAYGRFCRAHARPRRLPAPVAVRGLVPLARPRRRGDRRRRSTAAAESFEEAFE